MPIRCSLLSAACLSTQQSRRADRFASNFDAASGTSPMPRGVGSSHYDPSRAESELEGLKGAAKAAAARAMGTVDSMEDRLRKADEAVHPFAMCRNLNARRAPSPTHTHTLQAIHPHTSPPRFGEKDISGGCPV
eukprot:9472582-Pyramimonas_sp.AAC.1